ncbi:hypothetical protein OB919_21480 [Halobacteria archaeon AArc-curdl1]|uniref:Uncharacterized protein n=1 Tax=Natronosalvus hydrolyticus TaxID=2979988 RepID=A0AAP2ZCB5_9EURY|nr:hypothetical protein [Halobacteria archaeon AArc-curdl1]
MGILAALAKLLPLIGKLWIILKLVSLLPLKGVILGLALLWKTKLWLVVVLVVGLLPEILGSYNFLTGEGVEWYFALPSAIGLQFGGAILDLITGLEGLATGSDHHEALLLIGMLLSLTSILWYIYFWHLANRFAEGANLSTLWIVGMGALFFLLCIVIALLVDQHVLADETIRYSGITYFIDDPGGALEPIGQWFGEAAEPPEGVNETDPINNTEDNNFTGGLE